MDHDAVEIVGFLVRDAAGVVALRPPDAPADASPTDKRPDKKRPSSLDDALKGLDKVGGLN